MGLVCLARLERQVVNRCPFSSFALLTGELPLLRLRVVSLPNRQALAAKLQSKLDEWARCCGTKSGSQLIWGHW